MAPTPASCARSSAPQQSREGRRHDQAFQSVAARYPQGRRRPGRRLLARRPHRAGARRAARRRRSEPLALTEVDAFLAIDAQGRVTVYSGKVDLGTGVRTALAQIAADELDVPFGRVRIVEGDTALTPDQGKTWGSLTIQVGGVQIRNAAATARAALVERGRQAARRQAGRRSPSPTASSAPAASRVSYGELIGGKTFALKLDHAKPAKSKDPKDYKIVGKSVPRVDIPDKVTGRFTYMQDFRVRGMLHGRVIRPPAMGAKLESVDEGSIKDIAGIVQVVRDGNFLGVVAQTEWAAIKARARPQGQLVEMGGAAGAGQAVGARAHRARCSRTRPPATSATPPRRWPRRASRSSPPPTTSRSTPTARSGRPVRSPNSRTASSPRGPPRRRPTLCASNSPTCSRLPLENVRCIYLEGSGCYGRNGHEDAAADAALLAKAVGRPVRVQWSRADEHGWDPKGPPTLIDLRAALDGAGNVTAWESEFFIPQQTDKSFMVPLVAGDARGPAGGRPTSRPATSSRTRPSPTSSPTSKRSATGSRRRRSGRPGSARRAGCRTPTPTSASWTSLRRRPAPTRSSSA